ncbi:MAG TPA: hypothetical protein VIV60_30655 [Polyangiaceae bacterium]
MPTGTLRDELVRAVMPELRLLMDHLVNTAVERSIAPLLEKQNELEAALKELRNLQLRSDQAAIATAKEATLARAAHTESRAHTAANAPSTSRGANAPIQAEAHERSRVRTQTTVAVVTCDAHASLDIPEELNGSRRKKLVAVMVGTILVVLLLFAVGMSVLSNMGTYL